MKNSSWKEVFSEKGAPSSKRVLGAFCLLVCPALTSYLVIKEGGTNTAEALIQTFIITASALLGISSVTNAFSRGDRNDKDKDSESSESY